MVEMTWANFCSALGTEVTDVVTETNADAEDGIRIDGTTAYIKGIKVSGSPYNTDVDNTGGNRTYIPNQLKNADFTEIDVSSMTQLNDMFVNSKLETLNISGWKTPISSTKTSTYTDSNGVSKNLMTIKSNLSEMFMGCTSLKSLNIDFSFTFDEYKSEDTDVECFVNLTYMFYNNDSLEHLDLSKLKFNEDYFLNHVNTSWMIANCDNLTDVDLSNCRLTYFKYNYDDIDNYCKNVFYGCYKLKLIKTNEHTLIQIGDSTFKYCKSLENFTFNDNCVCYYNPYLNKTYVRLYNTFEYCESLEWVKFENLKIIDLDTQTFVENGLIYFESTFKDSALSSLDFLNCFTTSYGENHYILDGLSYSFQGTNLEIVDESCPLNNLGYEIPTLSINGIFANCKKLKKVSLPNLTLCHNSTNQTLVCAIFELFSGCTSLEYVNLKRLVQSCFYMRYTSFVESGVSKYIGSDIFKDCDNLKYIDFSEWGRYITYEDVSRENRKGSFVSIETKLSKLSAYKDKTIPATFSTKIFYDLDNLQELHLEYANIELSGFTSDELTQMFEGTSAKIFTNSALAEKLQPALASSDSEIIVSTLKRSELYDKIKDSTEIRSDTVYANKGKIWTDDDGITYINDVHVYDEWSDVLPDYSISSTKRNQYYDSTSFIPTTTATKIDLSQLDVSHLRQFYYIFRLTFGQSSELKIEELNVTNWKIDFDDSYTMFEESFKEKPKMLNCVFRGWTYREGISFNSLKRIIGLDTWDISEFEDLSYIFADNNSLEDVGDLSNWNTNNVTNMSSLFLNCYLITSDKISFIENWNTSNVTNMRDMFNNCSSLSSLSFIENLDTSKVTSLYSTFSGVGNKKTAFDLDLSNWNTSSVESMGSAFCGSNFSSINLTGWNPKLKGNNNYVFNSCKASTITGIDNFEFEEDVNISEMFQYCPSLTSLDLSNWNTTNVINLNAMFYKCPSLTSLDLSNWDISNVTDISNMFNDCSSLTSLGDLSNWNPLNVTSMRGTFEGCSSLTSLGDLSNWNTSNVTSLYVTFSKCKLLSEETLNSVNGWDVSKVTSIVRMFEGCEQLTKIKLDNWVGEEITTMGGLFTDCINLKYIDLRSLTTAKTKSAEYIFKNCNNPVVNMHSATFESISSVKTTPLIGSNDTNLDDWINAYELGNYSTKEIDLSSFNYNFSSIQTNTNSDNAFYAVSNFLFFVLGVYKFPALVFTNNTSFVTRINAIKTDSHSLELYDYMKILMSRVSTVQGVDSTLDTIKVTDVVEKLNQCEAIYESSKGERNESKIKEVLGVDDYDSYCFKIENELPEEASDVWQLPIYLDNYTPTEEEQTKFGVEDKIILNGAMYVHNYPVTETGLATSTGSLDVSFDFNDESTLTPVFKSSEESGMFNTVRSINLNGMIPQNINDFRGLFAYSFNDKAELDVSEWDLTLPSTLDDEEESNPTYIQSIFEGSKLTSIDVSFLNGCEITTLESAFANCPNLTEITGMENLDMSKVTNFKKAFYTSPKLANLDLSSFDVSSATTFNNTFANDNLGTQDVSSWDVSNVTSMEGMFLNSTGNITGFTEWNTENVEDFSFMFSHYKQDKLSISGFNFENKRDTRSMFSDSKIGTLDITYITLPKSKFNTCTFEGYTNPDDEDDYYPKKMYITEWNTRYTPLSETSIEHPLLFNDDVFSGLKCRMYYGEKWAGEKEPTTYGGADIKWIKYGYYFKNVVSAIKEYEDIEHITCKDEIEEGIHNDDDTKSLNVNVWIQDDGSDNVAFSNLPTTLKTVDIKGLSHFNLVTSMKEMFKDCTQLTSVKFGAIDVSSVTTMESMFENCPLLEETVGLEYFNTESLEIVSKAFKGCEVLPPQDFSEWDMSKITDMSYMLEGNQQINDYSLTGWNLPKLESMKGFFKSCHNLERLYLMGGENEQILQFSSELDESADVSYLFEDCTSLTWDSIDAFSVLVNNNTAYDLTGLFKDCTSITDFHFDTDNEGCSIAMYNVHTLDYMFEGCTGLTTVNCSNLIGSITEHEEGIDYDTVNLKGLFKNCSNLTEVTDVNDWYTFNFKTIDELFSGTAIEELDIRNWTCDNITSCSGMFANCSNLSKMYLIGWNSGVDVDTEDMFENCDGTKLYISEGWIYGHSRTFGNAVSLTFMMKCTPPRLYLDGYEIKIIKDIKTFNENSSIAPIGEVKIITQSSDTINISVACSTSANDVLEIIPLAETNVSFANYEDYFETINLKKYDYIRLIGDGAGHWLLQDYQSRNTAGMKETVIKYCGEIGELRFFPTSEYRYGYLFCDGSTFDKDIYDEFFILWKKYFEKDCGYDRFGNPKLPDFTDGRYICGSNSCESPYKKIEAGLPNITGIFIGGKTDASRHWTDGGAFVNYSSTSAFSGSSGPMANYTFNASRSNKIFGKSDTITPKSVKMHIFIKVI